jgi:hypothetical protein
MRCPNNQVGDTALFINSMNVEDIVKNIALLWNGASLRKRIIERSHALSVVWTEEQFSARLTATIEPVIGLF